MISPPQTSPRPAPEQSPATDAGNPIAAPPTRRGQAKLPEASGHLHKSVSETWRLRLGCVLCTALLWWLAGQQPGWFALGWIALTPLLWALYPLEAGARWRWGHAAGWLGYTLINWWITPSIIKGSPLIGVSPLAGAALGVLAVMIIGVVHGLQVALTAWMWNPRSTLAQRAPWSLPILIALLWATLDAIRSTTTLAHSWGALAYTQWRDLPLLQSASIIGQHGLTALCVWFAASLALWLRRPDAASLAYLWRAPVLVFLALHIWGAWRLKSFDTRSASAQRTMRVLLVQTNVPSLRKNEEDDAPGEMPFPQALRLTQEHFDSALQPVDVVVWPETTATIGREAAALTAGHGGSAAPHVRAIADLARRQQASFLVGAQGWGRGDELYNQVLLVAPDGQEQRSVKIHLVPFGERAPYSEYLPFLERFAPRVPMTPGDRVEPMPLRLPDSKDPLMVGSLICFESCFQNPARELRRRGAQVLFVVTNDEWSSGTTAPWEHAAMAAMRAVENGVPVVQAANAGYSLVVDPRGRFVVKSTFGKAQAIAADVPLP